MTFPEISSSLFHAVPSRRPPKSPSSMIFGGILPRGNSADKGKAAAGKSLKRRVFSYYFLWIKGYLKKSHYA